MQKVQVIYMQYLRHDKKCKGRVCRKANFTTSQIISPEPAKDVWENRSVRQEENVASSLLNVIYLNCCKKCIREWCNIIKDPLSQCLVFTVTYLQVCKL